MAYESPLVRGARGALSGGLAGYKPSSAGSVAGAALGGLAMGGAGKIASKLKAVAPVFNKQDAIKAALSAMDTAKKGLGIVRKYASSQEAQNAGRAWEGAKDRMYKSRGPWPE
jgi:hypothetical protein